MINKHFGGNVDAHPLRRDGQCSVHIKPDCSIFAGLAESEKVLLTHGDSVTPQTVAANFTIVAKTDHHVAGA